MPCDALNDLIYDLIVYDLIVYDLIVYELIVYELIVYDLIVYDFIVYYFIIYDFIVLLKTVRGEILKTLTLSLRCCSAISRCFDSWRSAACLLKASSLRCFSRSASRCLRLMASSCCPSRAFCLASHSSENGKPIRVR